MRMQYIDDARAVACEGKDRLFRMRVAPENNYEFSIEASANVLLCECSAVTHITQSKDGHVSAMFSDRPSTYLKRIDPDPSQWHGPIGEAEPPGSW